MALIKPRYPEQPQLQHAYTLFVFQQVPLSEVSFRTRLSSADLRERIEQDGWEIARRSVRAAYEQHVGRELNVIALRHAVPYLINQLSVSEKLSTLVHRALDKALKATIPVEEGGSGEEVAPGALALLARVAKDASEIGGKALGLGGVGLKNQEAPGSVAVNISVITRQLDAHSELPLDASETPIDVDFSADEAP